MSRIGRRPFHYVALLLSVGCGDSSSPDDLPDEPLPPSPFVVSNPVAQASGGAAMAWVYLPDSALPGAQVIDISNPVRGSESTVHANARGGSPLVPIVAQAGDTLRAVVNYAASQKHFLMLVPASAAPRLIRITPADEATDVSREPVVRLEFSEPITPWTAAVPAWIQKGIDLVPSDTRYADSEHHAIEVAATTILAPSTEYQVVVGLTLRDTDGQIIEGRQTRRFTTTDARLLPVITLKRPLNGKVLTDFAQVMAEITATRLSVSVTGVLEADNGWRYDMQFGIDSFMQPVLRFDWSMIGRIQPGHYHLTIASANSDGVDTLRMEIEAVDAGTESTLLVDDFKAIEHEYSADYWNYAPQIKVADSSGSNLSLVGFKMESIGSVQLSGAEFVAYPGKFTLTPTYTQIFPELYGAYPIGIEFSGGVLIPNPGPMRGWLFYRDANENYFVRAVEGPVVRGALPTTYTGGCGWWWFAGLRVETPWCGPMHAPVKVRQ